MPLTQFTSDLHGSILIPATAFVSRGRALALVANKKPLPRPQTLRLLVDTGATNTMLDHQIVQELELNPTGQATLQAVSNSGSLSVHDTYDVSLHLLEIASDTGSSLWSANTLQVATLAIKSAGFDGLLGTDILQHLNFIFDGMRREFILVT